jgi:hypothetical protein
LQQYQQHQHQQHQQLSIQPCAVGLHHDPSATCLASPQPGGWFVVSLWSFQLVSPVLSLALPICRF